MQIFSTFEHTTYLELAISALHLNGIGKDQIFAVPLNNRKQKRKLLDTIHSSDGVSLVTTGAALGTAFSVVTASIGFRLAWGPIYWGLIGAVSGFLLGFMIDLFVYKVIKKNKRLLKGKTSEVILIVDCDKEQSDHVESILWHHFALGVARIEKG